MVQSEKADATTTGLKAWIVLSSLLLAVVVSGQYVMRSPLQHTRAASFGRLAFPYYSHQTPLLVKASATQCGRDYSASFPVSTNWSAPCDDFEGSMRNGARSNITGQFVPAGQCALRWFSPRQACAIVESLGFMLILGDSITRQLDTGLHMVLSGDYSFTAPPGPSDTLNCSCGNQFSPHCPYRSPTGTSPEMPHVEHVTMMDWKPSRWCPLWKREHVLHIGAGGFSGLPARKRQWAGTILPPHNGTHSPARHSHSRSNGSSSSSSLFVYANWGMWSDMRKPASVIEKEWAPTLALMRAQGYPQLDVVCGMEPACGRHKNKNYLEKQGNAVVGPYNAAVRDWCHSQGLQVFEQVRL